MIEIPDECCDFGTFKCAVPMAINGRRHGIDICIADIVAALNAANITTVGSCCGHSEIEGSIVLGDGRELTVSNVKRTIVKCYGCGLEYNSPRWIETAIPDEIWDIISPTGGHGGTLCISCISERLKERGLKDVPVWLVGDEPLKAMPGGPQEETD